MHTAVYIAAAALAVGLWVMILIRLVVRDEQRKELMERRRRAIEEKNSQLRSLHEQHKAQFDGLRHQVEEDMRQDARKMKAKGKGSGPSA